MNNIEKVLNSKLKNKISDFCVKISENIGKVEAKFSLDMIFGLISGGNILLSEVGRGLKEKLKIKQTVKRLSRNLTNFKEENIHEIRDILLTDNKKHIGEETVITLDGGDINKAGAMKMENIKDIRDGSTGKTVNGYWMDSIVATNVINKNEVNTIPLNIKLYSTKSDHFESQNRESMKAIDEVIKIIGNIGLWVLDRGYDRAKNIIKELVERNLSFIIRGIGSRDVIRLKNEKKILMKTLADQIRTRKRITYFEYKITKYGEKKKQQLSGRVGYEKIRIPGVKSELTLCVLKKLSGQLSMMMITNKKIENNTDVIDIFSKYSSRWGVEDTYKYIKQEFQLEKIMLKNYSGLQNIMIFLLASMIFVGQIRRGCKYFAKVLIEKAKALNEKVLKYKEHAIIAGIRVLLALNSLGIRDFIRKKIKKLHTNNLRLFDHNQNPYEILGKL